MNEKLMQRVDALGIYEATLLFYCVIGYLDGNEEFEQAVEGNIELFEKKEARIFAPTKSREVARG